MKKKEKIFNIYNVTTLTIMMATMAMMMMAMMMMMTTTTMMMMMMMRVMMMQIRDRSVAKPGCALPSTRLTSTFHLL